MENVTRRRVVPAAEEILGLYFRVLDHGFVSLIDYMGSDDTVLESARVSYGIGTKSGKDDRGLLRYMLKHKHTSPFEQVILRFHVKLPIFVARQLIRHRTASLNEYSMRYSLPAMQFYVPEPKDMGTQSKKNKQGRAEPVTSHQADAIQMKWRLLQREAVELYEIVTSKDVDLARELARIGLPLSIYTEWVWSMDMHNLMHFLCLRSDGHAQWEIQQYSNMKASIMRAVAPMTYEAWVDYKFQSCTFSRTEMVLLRRLLGTSIASGLGLAPAATHVQVTSGDILKMHALELGMTDREWSEFVQVFDRVNTPDLYEKPADFKINLEDAIPAEVLQQEALASAPREL
jgi:thymidylate synthase (FAD)